MTTDTVLVGAFALNARNPLTQLTPPGMLLSSKHCKKTLTSFVEGWVLPKKDAVKSQSDTHCNWQ